MNVEFSFIPYPPSEMSLAQDTPTAIPIFLKPWRSSILVGIGSLYNLKGDRLPRSLDLMLCEGFP